LKMNGLPPTPPKGKGVDGKCQMLKGMTMKRYIKPQCAVIRLVEELPLAASRAVDFNTGVHRTEYKDDYIDDLDGDGDGSGGYTPIEWSVVH